MHDRLNGALKIEKPLDPRLTRIKFDWNRSFFLESTRLHDRAKDASPSQIRDMDLSISIPII